MKISPGITRRQMLRLTGGLVTGAAGLPHFAIAAEGRPQLPHGAVIGEPKGAAVGAGILAAGGNAVDAIVAAALASSVGAPNQCGIGGYGGHLIVALADGRTVTAIDFNSMAPAAARPDIFLDAAGEVRREAHFYGWLAAGVPGTLAGLQLALSRYGTLSFRDVVAPAIRLAADGFPLENNLASAIRASAKQFANDPGSRRLYFREEQPLQAGDTFRNPELADLLATLARRNSVESFYRGDIARRIAEGFSGNGGLLTFDDLAAYQAREIAPLRFRWRQHEVCTAPLTAGGLTVLEALSFLRELNWPEMPAGPAKTHARLEALRVAWHDRLTLLGDPEHAPVPVKKLLARDYAVEVAQRIRSAVQERVPLAGGTSRGSPGGTVHLSSVDRLGNMAALTLTHGGTFGARVTVDGLGLTLGHGMSRFEPRPHHPNSPGPHKRPLHNMCPTVVRRDGQPVLALGGAGGRRIPNAVFDVLTHYLCVESDLAPAMEAARLHTEGDLNLTLESSWPVVEAASLKQLGYTVRPARSATISSVAFDQSSGAQALRR